MKIHLCCGDIFLLSYENCDINGYTWDYSTLNAKKEYWDLESNTSGVEILNFPDGNPNSTIIENYFKRPFEEDSTKRPEKLIIVDRIMNILEKWPWKDYSIKEIVLVNALEHFDYKEQIPHIINEANRVLKSGGIFKFDFPDILEIVRKYYNSNPHYCMELLYGSRKNIFSRHEWGFTKNSIYGFFDNKNWELKFRNVVTHDYPSTGVFATKI